MGDIIIGIDLGATNIRVGTFEKGVLKELASSATPNKGSVQTVLDAIYALVDPFMNSSVAAIGVGVPSVVDVQEGVVYNVQHIPSWIEVPLKKLMEAKYHIPTLVNNDANCFAVGEYYFGKGKGAASMIGLAIGTGLGAGVMIHHKLYNGRNCGAGEFGSIKYLDANMEYYASGSFFKNIYNCDGLQVFEQAQKQDQEALTKYKVFGKHMGQVIKTVMYAYDPDLIVLGGSVSQAYPFFKDSMYAEMQTFDYPTSIQRIKIEISDLKNSGVYGAAALYYDNDTSQQYTV